MMMEGGGMDVRRVVTGHDEKGKAVFTGDTMVSPIRPSLLPGVEFHRLWGSDGPVTYPDAGREPEAVAYFPPVGGFRFGFFTLPPGTDASSESVDVERGMAELQELLPGLIDVMELDEPGMHTTDTTDFEVVLSGRVVLELDDGAEVTLGPGDTVVQNGTRHRWRNPHPDPVVIAVFIVGAHRAA
jgi:mannose-6-phosphate isomerase-like protein (cupin superfamily)